MEFTQAQAWWSALVFTILPFLVWLVFSWNELRYVKTQSSDGAKLPPGHLGFPVIGQLLSFIWYFRIRRNPDDFVNSMRKRYGDADGIYRSYLFGSPAIIGCSPDFNKFVLQSSNLFQATRRQKDIFGHNSVAVVNGKAHYRLRGYINNTISTPDALKKITICIQPNIVSSLQSWAEKGKIKGVYDIKKVFFETICIIITSFKPGPAIDMLDQHFHAILDGLGEKGTKFHQAVQSKKTLTEVFKKEIDKRTQHGIPSEDQNDLMERLMRMRDEDGEPLSDDEVIDNIVTCIMGGYESPFQLAIWALYFLAKNNDVLQKLREENLAIDKKGELLTSEDLAHLKYTKKVVEETLRMANIGTFFVRTAEKDVTYRGNKIPKNWLILLWTRYLHNNTENFEDPMKFNPDRWDETPKPGTFQPFGLGPRICPANMLSKTQLVIFIHHVVVGYKWELTNPNVKISYVPQPMPSDGLEINFSKL